MLRPEEHIVSGELLNGADQKVGQMFLLSEMNRKFTEKYSFIISVSDY